MNMTNEEILADFKAAKAPMKQIGILADMNCCTKQEIVQILLEAGADVPKNYLGTRKKQLVVDPVPAVEPTVDQSADDDTVDAAEALPIMIRMAAFSTIEKLEKDYERGEEFSFRSAVIGVLAVVHEVEKRCKEVSGNG